MSDIPLINNQSTEIYIPKSVIKNTVVKQRRVGLLAPSGGGKTTSALTFPNVIVLDFDGGLTAFKDVDVVPFHDNDFMQSFLEGKYKPQTVGALPNRRDALTKWLETEGLKLKQGQTLVIDSWTTLQNGFDAQQEREKAITQDGEENKFVFWREKIKFSEKVCTLIMSMKCDVVVTFHEMQVRDKKTGLLLDKIQALMQGGFSQELKIYFTDFYRIVTEDKTNAKLQVYGSNYYWQVRGDSRFDAKCRFKDLPIGIFKVPAHYRFFDFTTEIIEKGTLKGMAPDKAQETFNGLLMKELGWII